MSILRVLATLTLGCGLLVAPPAAAGDVENGRAWRDHGVLRAGCHHYRFRYRARPRHHDWSLELFLRGPRGKQLGTVVRDSDIDPRRGRGRFEVCRNTTRPGRFTISGKLSVYGAEEDGFLLTESPEEPDVRWIQPARFRLRRA
jgi:hypothetical protein